MTNGWSGVDPTIQNEPGVDYELGDRFTANVDLEITHARLWFGGDGSAPRANRNAKIWSVGGVLQTQTPLDAAPPPGWTNYALPAPLAVAAGTSLYVSYDTERFYGAVTSPGYPALSSDGSLTYTAGRFNNTPDVFPDTASGAFYGIDVVYQLGGNLPPVVGLAVSSAGLTGFATITVEDETPGSVNYHIEWGDGAVTNTASLTSSHAYATSGAYSVLVLATDAGGSVGAASEVLLIVGPPAGKELEIQRQTTLRFIDARPTLLALTPRASIKSGSGVRDQNLTPRAAQVARLIEVAAGAGPIPTPDGFQDRSTFELLLPWDGSVGNRDFWVDGSGVRWEVTDILPFNGYEVRAEVVRLGTGG